uniref:Uncharacterized protein n=1 Tax=Anguilla anguilla TaxID=7936 RepID=A0A0E9VDS5_ANGAN
MHRSVHEKCHSTLHNAGMRHRGISWA